ncbi:hypothetical protein [Marasmitruncus massiliensis]|uniref:hypothetical protein n=1 Tax=Marasmitruncus massiliensis TaxID=1944642 RepID=UPI000C7BECA4|nr:hypothetical protein [Marasmitruncus massiliensis]
MIVVTAGLADKKFNAIMKKGGNGTLSILEVQTQNAAFLGDEPDLVLVTGQKIEQISCRNAVFLVRGHSSMPEKFCCEQAVAVVDSSDQSLLEQVAQHHIKALTCGLASVDTLTLSSFTTDSAVISLQRQIEAFDGTVLEPFELPVSFSTHVEPFSLLSCAAVFCFLGKKNPLINCKLWELQG